VRVTAGADPATGERIVLTEMCPTLKEAERARTRLLAEADALKNARTKASFGYLLDRWLVGHDVEITTRATYDSLIRTHIRPALGAVPLTKIHRGAAEILEGLYADLRRCSRRCDGRPFTEHRTVNDHDCSVRRCPAHVCRPLSASTVRQVHAIVSGALTAAVRWGWLPFNPAETARIPAKVRPAPDPPSPADAARIVEAAWRDDDEWGLYLWLAMVTGARRGELLALRVRDVDLDTGVMTIRRNYVWVAGAGHDKNTKSHQMRRVSIDAVAVDLVRSHLAAVKSLLEQVGMSLQADMYLFSAEPGRGRPRDPSSQTRRYKRMVDRLGLDTNLHELRHYSATELLTAGVDVRTVAGRLGHGDGTTTLRYYAAWRSAADRGAAGVVSAGLPVPARSITTAVGRSSLDGVSR